MPERLTREVVKAVLESRFDEDLSFRLEGMDPAAYEIFITSLADHLNPRAFESYHVEAKYVFFKFFHRLLVVHGYERLIVWYPVLLDCLFTHHEKLLKECYHTCVLLMEKDVLFCTRVFELHAKSHLKRNQERPKYMMYPFPYQPVLLLFWKSQPRLFLDKLNYIVSRTTWPHSTILHLLVRILSENSPHIAEIAPSPVFLLVMNKLQSEKNHTLLAQYLLAMDMMIPYSTRTLASYVKVLARITKSLIDVCASLTDDTQDTALRYFLSVFVRCMYWLLPKDIRPVVEAANPVVIERIFRPPMWCLDVASGGGMTSTTTTPSVVLAAAAAASDRQSMLTRTCEQYRPLNDPRESDRPAQMMDDVFYISSDAASHDAVQASVDTAASVARVQSAVFGGSNAFATPGASPCPSGFSSPIGSPLSSPRLGPVRQSGSAAPQPHPSLALVPPVSEPEPSSMKVGKEKQKTKERESTSSRDSLLVPPTPIPTPSSNIMSPLLPSSTSTSGLQSSISDFSLQGPSTTSSPSPGSIPGSIPGPGQIRSNDSQSIISASAKTELSQRLASLTSSSSGGGPGSGALSLGDEPSPSPSPSPSPILSRSPPPSPSPSPQTQTQTQTQKPKSQSSVVMRNTSEFEEEGDQYGALSTATATATTEVEGEDSFAIARIEDPDSSTLRMVSELGSAPSLERSTLTDDERSEIQEQAERDIYDEYVRHVKILSQMNEPAFRYTCFKDDVTTAPIYKQLMELEWLLENSIHSNPSRDVMSTSSSASSETIKAVSGDRQYMQIHMQMQLEENRLLYEQYISKYFRERLKKLHAQSMRYSRSETAMLIKTIHDLRNKHEKLKSKYGRLIRMQDNEKKRWKSWQSKQQESYNELVSRSVSFGKEVQGLRKDFQRVTKSEDYLRREVTATRLQLAFTEDLIAELQDCIQVLVVSRLSSGGTVYVEGNPSIESGAGRALSNGGSTSGSLSFQSQFHHKPSPVNVQQQTQPSSSPSSPAVAGMAPLSTTPPSTTTTITTRIPSSSSSSSSSNSSPSSSSPSSAVVISSSATKRSEANPTGDLTMNIPTRPRNTSLTSTIVSPGLTSDVLDHLSSGGGALLTGSIPSLDAPKRSNLSYARREDGTTILGGDDSSVCGRSDSSASSSSMAGSFDSSITTIPSYALPVGIPDASTGLLRKYRDSGMLDGSPKESLSLAGVSMVSEALKKHSQEADEKEEKEDIGKSSDIKQQLLDSSTSSSHSLPSTSQLQTSSEAAAYEDSTRNPIFPVAIEDHMMSGGDEDGSLELFFPRHVGELGLGKSNAILLEENIRLKKELNRKILRIMVLEKENSVLLGQLDSQQQMNSDLMHKVEIAQQQQITAKDVNKKLSDEIKNLRVSNVNNDSFASMPVVPPRSPRVRPARSDDPFSEDNLQRDRTSSGDSSSKHARRGSKSSRRRSSVGIRTSGSIGTAASFEQISNFTEQSFTE